MGLKKMLSQISINETHKKLTVVNFCHQDNSEYSHMNEAV